MTTETQEYASKGVAGTGLGLGIAGTALGLLNGGLNMAGRQNGACGYGYGPGCGYGYGPGPWYGPWYGPRGTLADPETQAALREHDRIEDKYVSQKELDLNSKIMARDSEISILKSEKYTDQKLVEVYADIERQINGVKDKVDANRDRADDRLADAFEKLNLKADVVRDRADMRIHDAFEKLNCKIDANKAFQDGVNAQQLAYNGTNNATICCMKEQINDLKGMTKLVIPNSTLCPGVPPVYLTHIAPALSA